MTAPRPATAAAPRIKDDIFGVCRRLGEDFGFHPNILRIALAVGLIWSIEGVFAAYAVLAAIVLFSRLVAPDRRPVPQPEQSAPAATDQDIQPVDFARAA